MEDGEATHGGHVRLVALGKHFGDVVAVDDIDLDIRPGEFFSLLGPSGCGKTTTLRMIAGFEQPTSGQILLDDRDLVAVPPHRRPVNTVFQSYALFPHLTVGENIAYGLRWRSGIDKAERRRRVFDAIELVRIARPRGAPSGPAVGRPAAAGGAGAGADPRPQGAAARRAARRPRRPAAQGPPGRPGRPPARGRDHVRVRDPRPGGGADDVAPPRRDASRSGGPDRRAGRGLRAAGVGLRRRLPRRRQPPRRRDRAGPRRPPGGAHRGLPAGGLRDRSRRSGQGRHPPRAGARRAGSADRSATACRRWSTRSCTSGRPPGSTSACRPASPSRR